MPRERSACVCCRLFSFLLLLMDSYLNMWIQNHGIEGLTSCIYLGIHSFFKKLFIQGPDNDSHMVNVK